MQQLEAAGVPHANISLAFNDAADVHGKGSGASLTFGDAEQGAETGVRTGALLGTVLGGDAGLLAGIGALAIPGVCPIVAAGWLVAALTDTGTGAGAAAGGLIGLLTGAGCQRRMLTFMRRACAAVAPS